MNDKIELQKKQYMKMTTESIPKLVGLLAIPTIISMLVTNIYNLVDTAFVGQLGTSASGAIGIVFGYMSILQAIGFMCGQGTGSIIARLLGKKDIERAIVYTSTGFAISFLLGVIVAILSYLQLHNLVKILGSTNTIETYAIDYIKYIILAAPFMTSSLTMNNLLRYEGKAKLGMIGLLSGAILNICGDEILIFKCNMGINGAGMSTAIAQVISFVILFSMFAMNKTQTKIKFNRISVLIKEWSNICSTGIPSMIRQALNSISTMLLNANAACYGDEALAAMSIVGRIVFFVMSVAIGIGQGFQPVSSFNYGARKYKRVKKAFWVTVVMSEILLISLDIPVIIFAPKIIRLFRDDALVIHYGTRALRLLCYTLLFVPLTMVTEMGFQSTGQRMMASLASSLRSGILFIPTLIVLANVRGFYGIQEAQPLSFMLSFVVCVIFSNIFLKKCDSMHGNNKTI